MKYIYIQMSFTWIQLKNKCSIVSVSTWQNEQDWLLTFFMLYNNLFVGTNHIIILYCKSLVLLSTGHNVGIMNIFSHSSSVIIPWIDSFLILYLKSVSCRELSFFSARHTLMCFCELFSILTNPDSLFKPRVNPWALNNWSWQIAWIFHFLLIHFTIPHQIILSNSFAPRCIHVSKGIRFSSSNKSTTYHRNPDLNKQLSTQGMSFMLKIFT